MIRAVAILLAAAALPTAAAFSIEELRASSRSIPPIHIEYQEQWLSNPSVESRNLLRLVGLCNRTRAIRGLGPAATPSLASLQDHMTMKHDLYADRDKFASYVVGVEYELDGDGDPPTCRLTRHERRSVDIFDGRTFFSDAPHSGVKRSRLVVPPTQPVNYVFPTETLEAGPEQRQVLGERCAVRRNVARPMPATLAAYDYNCLWSRFPGLRLHGAPVFLERSGLTAMDSAADLPLPRDPDDLSFIRAVRIDVGRAIDPQRFRIPAP
jgi:hypothetical protein